MKKRSRLISAGRDPRQQHGIVNPPVYRASTVLFPDMDALEHASRRPFEGVYYGRHGTPTTFAFEAAMAELERAERAIAVSSGLAAIAVSLLAFLEQGDHVLVADNVYGPTRIFCDNFLQQMGVQTTYYDPLLGEDIKYLMDTRTRVVFMESPGSLTFEVQDVPAIAREARAQGVVSVIDNTWATPLYLPAIEHGVDISLHAATKYITGHADAMLGVINTREEYFTRLKRTAVTLGNCPGSEECNLGLRGLRTLDVRLERHGRTALQIAEWLQGQPEVRRVLHPALPDDPGHALWQRDFEGASGLFSFILNPVSRTQLAAMLDGLEHFGMGYSWGGYESLILPVDPPSLRTATQWEEPGQVIRVHAGLEDPEDLIADLAAGLARL